jgi:hypothetical protein
MRPPRRVGKMKTNPKEISLDLNHVSCRGSLFLDDNTIDPFHGVRINKLTFCVLDSFIL